MNLNYLTTSHMCLVSQALVDARQLRSLVARHPRLAVWLPAVEKAHRAVLDQVHKSHDEDPTAVRLQSLRERMGVLARSINTLGRGVHAHLSSSAVLATTTARAEQLEQLQLHLFPAGVRFFTDGYAALSTACAEFPARILKAHREALRAVPVCDGHLWQRVETLCTQMTEFRSLDLERSALERALATAAKSGVSAREQQRVARNTWIRTLKAFVALVELEDELTSADRDRILGPIEMALARAVAANAASAARAANNKNDEDESDEDEDQDSNDSNDNNKDHATVTDARADTRDTRDTTDERGRRAA